MADEIEQNQSATSGTSSEVPEQTITVKRGRGRPPKNPGDPKKPAARAAQASAPEKTAAGIAYLSVALSAGFKIPELQLSADDARRLAEAYAAVEREFGLSIDPKTAAIAGLVMTAASIAVPRVISYKVRKGRELNEAHARAQQAAQQAQQAAEVAGAQSVTG